MVETTQVLLQCIYDHYTVSASTPAKLLHKCLPLQEPQEGGCNLLRIHALHLLNATLGEHIHLFTLVNANPSTMREFIKEHEL